MVCSMCGDEDTHTERVTVTIQRDATTLVVRNVPADVCDNCGEQFITGATHLVLERMLAEAVAAHADVQISHYPQAA